MSASILEQIQRTRLRFRPENLADVVALACSRLLENVDDAHGYARLASTFGVPELVTAAREVSMKRRRATVADREAPYVAVKCLLDEGLVGQSILRGSPIAAITVERRRCAVVLHEHGRLQYFRKRELPASGSPAADSIETFLDALSERLRNSLIVIEQRGSSIRTRRADLSSIVLNCVRKLGIPTLAVNSRELHATYGEPPCPTRQELRVVAERLWPEIGSREVMGLVLDASALAFHAFVTRALEPSDRDEDPEQARTNGANAHEPPVSEHSVNERPEARA